MYNQLSPTCTLSHQDRSWSGSVCSCLRVLISSACTRLVIMCLSRQEQKTAWSSAGTCLVWNSSILLQVLGLSAAIYIYSCIYRPSVCSETSVVIYADQQSSSLASWINQAINNFWRSTDSLSFANLVLSTSWSGTICKYLSCLKLAFLASPCRDLIWKFFTCLKLWNWPFISTAVYM